VLALAASVLVPATGHAGGGMGVENDGRADGHSLEMTTCPQDPAALSAFSQLAQQLRAQGMALNAQCRAASGAWVVQVMVVDGLKASKVVRGPLADGHEVDMGTPAGVPLGRAPANAHGFSPDVQYNRQWLRSLMAKHQFNNLPDAWWHFAQQHSSPTRAAELEVAVR
jgi:D-alanyl-D-alanine dipeptidase